MAKAADGNVDIFEDESMDDISDPHSQFHPENVETELSNLRTEAAEKLSPELLQLGDFLLKSLDLTFQVRLSRTSNVAEKALAKAENAEKIAVRAEQTATTTQENVEGLSNELRDLRAEVVAQGKKIADLEADRGASKLDSFHPALAGVLGCSVTESSPSQRVGKLHSSFLSLVQKKDTTTTFILGCKQGYPSVTRATAKGVMSVFFPMIKCVVTKPDNAEFARVQVPNPQEARVVAEGVRTLWSDLATQGWWLSDDSPEQLRKLEARGRAFVAAAKKFKLQYKKVIGYIEIEHGFLMKNGVELLPLFLIPQPSGKNWDALFEKFVEKVKAVDAADLLGQYAEVQGPHNTEDFFLSWMDVAGMKSLAADVRAIRSVPPSAN
jgi:hypothetical protein